MKDKLAKTLIASSGLLLAQSGGAHAVVIDESTFGPFGNAYSGISRLPIDTHAILGLAGGSAPFDFVRLTGYAPGQAFSLDLSFTASGDGSGGGSAPGSGSGSEPGSGSDGAGSGGTGAPAALGEIHFIQGGSFVFFAGDSGNAICEPGSAPGSGDPGSDPGCAPPSPGDRFGLLLPSFHVTGFASAAGFIDMQIGGATADYELTITTPSSPTDVPAPSSLALMAAAAAGAGFLRRRRKT